MIKYNYIIKTHIAPDLGDYPVAELNSVIINKFLKRKLLSGGVELSQPLAPSYVATMSLIISSTMRFAANENFCSALKNPIFKPTESNKEIQILKGMDVKSLSEILGHANTSTTMQIYVHPSMDIKRKQINKVFQ